MEDEEGGSRKCYLPSIVVGVSFLCTFCLFLEKGCQEKKNHRTKYA
ncbi:hypothetical protein SLEP1_g12518 [Rubroshorea leprosula]|uniref:Uncharacterized protein n=1 Tax=Rubroshorea leprosula TaxID=152421 RepID=A0AAV5ILH8_9ROSI|nr:hypothetical protein SLEP1_g12518 [Rubroshorea leprosula]